MLPALVQTCQSLYCIFCYRQAYSGRISKNNPFFLDQIAFFCYFSGAMARKRQQITVGFVALGCPKNVVDSERMLAEIAEAGLLINAEPDNADVIVINTCGFIEPAKAESLAAIRHAVDCKLTGTVKKVIVAGCLSERLGRELFHQAKGIDAVIGLGQRDNIAKIIKTIFSFGRPSAYLGPPSPTRSRA